MIFNQFFADTQIAIVTNGSNLICLSCLLNKDVPCKNIIYVPSETLKIFFIWGAPLESHIHIVIRVIMRHLKTYDKIQQFPLSLVLLFSIDIHILITSSNTLLKLS